MTIESRRSFFLRNLVKGLFWLGIIVSLFVFMKHNVSESLIERFDPIMNKTGLILLIYCLSEIVFGIIPPELFMIWALRASSLDVYIQYAILFAFISYFAGITGYLFGRFLNTTRLYRYLRKRFLSKTEALLQTYGLYLILVASITPLPFSGVAMLVGSVKYPAKQYIYWSLARFIRFTLIAYVIWEANML